MASRPGPLPWNLGALRMTTILYVVSSGAGEANEPAPTLDPRHAMVTALAASGPHSSLGDEARIFDRLVGTWDCAYSFHSEDGSVRHSSGELRFGWTIDGRALQDLWISYPSQGAAERVIGTSVRFFDAKTGVWRVVFVAPAAGSTIMVQGGAEGDRIVLRGTDDGASLRWSFNDIQPDSFTWRGETSRDDGKTWRLEEEHYMRRRSERATDMIDELGASGAHPSLAGNAALFDRFVGAWDLDCVFYATDGTSTGFKGKWLFGWVLDGRVLQDVLIEGDGRSRHSRGTTLRLYDANSAQWHVVWIPPRSGRVIILRGGAEGDRIVLEGKEPEGDLLRWSFNDIQSDSFFWRGEISPDGGRSWRVEQEMRLTRDPR